MHLKENANAYTPLVTSGKSRIAMFSKAWEWYPKGAPQSNLLTAPVAPQKQLSDFTLEIASAGRAIKKNNQTPFKRTPASLSPLEELPTGSTGQQLASSGVAVYARLAARLLQTASGLCEGRPSIS
ncbi:MAG: hypothetical protein ABSD96_08445 [Candidatus Korobacteraceae bacterium]|jgi:hypothetical protein